MIKIIYTVVSYFSFISPRCEYLGYEIRNKRYSKLEIH